MITLFYKKASSLAVFLLILAYPWQLKACEFLDGLPTDARAISQVTGGLCESCQCVSESFSSDDLEKLKERYLAELSASIRLEYEEYALSTFASRMQAYEEVDFDCQLSGGELGCNSREYNKALQKVFDVYSGSEKNDGCIPDKTLRRVARNKTLENQLYLLREGEISKFGDMNDPVIKTYLKNEKELATFKGSYNELKDKLLSGKNQSMVKDFLAKDCLDQHKKMTQIYCQEPSSLPKDNALLERLLEASPDISNLSNANQKEIDLYSLTCMNNIERAESDSLYEVDSLVNADELARLQLLDEKHEEVEIEANFYCPLLKCKDINEAYDMLDFLSDSCEERDEPLNLGQLISDFKCKTNEAEDICFEEYFASLVDAYKPSDEPLPSPEKLLAGRSFDELQDEEKKEILKNYGVSDQSLKFLGENGVRHLFGQEMILPEIKQSTVQTPMQQKARDAAEKRFSQKNREVEARISEKVESERRQQPSIRERIKTNRALVEQKAQNARPDHFVRNQSVGANYRQNLRAQEINPSVESRSLGQRGQFSRPVNSALVTDEGELNFRDLEDEIKNLRQEAQQIKTEQERQVYRAKIEDLRSQVNQLRSQQVRNLAQGTLQNDVRQNRLEREPTREERRFINDRVINEDVQNSTEERIESSNEEKVAGNPARKALRNLALDNANDQIAESSKLSTGENVRYLEKSSQELPLLSLEGLDNVTPGESFILGVKEGEQVRRIEMLAESVNGDIVYRIGSFEELSLEAKNSLLESPFFEQYAHPEVKESLQRDISQAKKHRDLIMILEKERASL